MLLVRLCRAQAWDELLVSINDLLDYDDFEPAEKKPMQKRSSLLVRA